MAKKKSGSIAVPFLITIFLGLLIIGGGAYAVYNYLGLNGTKDLDEPTPRAAAIITEEDSHTILFILDEPDLKCSSTFVLMSSKPKEKEVVFMGIPTNTIAVVDGQQEHIKNSYDRGGAQAAVKFVRDGLGLQVDRYMKFDSAAFIKACDVFGGVTYTVEPNIAGFKKEGGDQYLNSRQMEILITYSMFSGREVQRAYTTASLLSSMINQTDGKRVSDNFKTSFDTIINMVATDITSVDYKNRQFAIRSMLENGKTISTFVMMDGESSNDDFIPSETFLADAQRLYFEVQ